MSDFKNCQVTKGTSNLRFKNRVSSIDVSDINLYAALINTYGAKIESISYTDQNGNEKSAYTASLTPPIIGLSTFLTFVQTTLESRYFNKSGTYTFENQYARVDYKKIQVKIFTAMINSAVILDIQFVNGETTEYDLSQIDVSPAPSYILLSTFYNGTYIDSNLANISQYLSTNSIEALDVLKNLHYIASWSQNNSPLVNVADPKVSFFVGYGGLKSFIIAGNYPTGVNGTLNFIEAYVANEVFYTMPSADINIEIEVDCSDLKKIKLKDVTGIYNSVSNAGGYGTPNYPVLADIVGTELKLYDGSNVLLGASSDLGYIPAYNPDTFTYIQSSELGINSFRRNKEYRLEYIVKMNDGNTLSCGKVIFIIDQCGGAVDPFEQLEDCVIKRLKSLFEKECSEGCSKEEDNEIDSLIKLKTKFEVIKSSLDQDSACVTELDIDKLLEQCKNGCAGC